MKTSRKSSAATKSKRAVKPVPEGWHTATPYLVCAGAAKAIAFYVRAFGAVEMSRVPGPDGKVINASIRIGDSMLMLNDEFPEMGVLGPKAGQASPVTIHLFVPDVDASFARAVKAGAKVKMPVTDMFWGDRYGQLEDPFGHSWSMATRLHNLTAKQIQAAAQAACG